MQKPQGTFICWLPTSCFTPEVTPDKPTPSVQHCPNPAQGCSTVSVLLCPAQLRDMGSVPGVCLLSVHRQHTEPPARPQTQHHIVQHHQSATPARPADPNPPCPPSGRPLCCRAGVMLKLSQRFLCASQTLLLCKRAWTDMAAANWGNLNSFAL